MKLLFVLSVVLVSNFARADSALRCVKYRFNGELRVAVANESNQSLKELAVKNAKEQSAAAAACANSLSLVGQCISVNEEKIYAGEHDGFGSLPASKITYLAQDTASGSLYANLSACSLDQAHAAISAAESAVDVIRDAPVQERLLRDAARANSIYNKL